MNRYKTLSIYSAIFLTLIPAYKTHAVIVAGARGGGDNTNNTTRAELESLAGVDDGHFFDNVFMLGEGNAVYLGFKNTDNGPVGYALSGIHLGNQSTLTIQSQTYNTQSRVAIDGSDLALYSFTHSSNIMPTLQPLQLASNAITNNTPVIMIGEGRNRVQDATTDADTSDAVSVTDGTGYTTTSTRLKRWGTNETSNFSGPGGRPGQPTNTFNIGGRDTVTFRTVFDEPSDGEWLTTNQAQAVTNDSGGGIFAPDGTLLGIMVAIEGPNANQARFGNTTLIADIATYRSFIDDETGGVLIPEPGALALAGIALGSAGLMAVLRKRRG